MGKKREDFSNLSSTTFADESFEKTRTSRDAKQNARCSKVGVGQKLHFPGVDQSTRRRGKGVGEGLSWTVCRNLPCKVEVCPSVEKREDEAEDDGLQEAACLPVAPPLQHLPQQLAHLDSFRLFWHGEDFCSLSLFERCSPHLFSFEPLCFQSLVQLENGASYPNQFIGLLDFIGFLKFTAQEETRLKRGRQAHLLSQGPILPSVNLYYYNFSCGRLPRLSFFIQPQLNRSKEGWIWTWGNIVFFVAIRVCW